MKVVAIIQARMGSTRLPGKVSRSLGGKSVLAHVVERVRQATRLDAVWVATTEAAADEALVEESARIGVPCFRGSEQDVLRRYAGAMKASEADVIIRVTSDCPLFDGKLLQAMIEEFERDRESPTPPDYLNNVTPRMYPRGLDAEIFTREALERADREATQAYEREHVTPYIYQHPERFRLAAFVGPEDLSEHRWTLDTPEDWRFVETVYEELYRGEPFGTGAVLKLLKRHPEIAKLNADVEQKKLSGQGIEMSQYETDQEKFWAGGFGDDYTARNRGARVVASNVAFFSRILSRTDSVGSVLELGANIGMNLRALGHLLPDAKLSAVEINAQAVEELQNLPGVEVHHQSLLEFSPPKQFDLVLIKGVLIHLNPEKLPEVYDLMHAASARYICIAEYYNPTPVTIPYRGHGDRLFKRDFAGELLQRHAGVRLIDYGFAYHGDPNFPQDDITWFLMEKPEA